MTNPRKPLRLNLGFLVSAPIGVSREFEFNITHLQVDEELSLDDFIGLTKVSRTPQGLFVQGEFEGTLPQECVRCLGQYQQDITFEFSELYAFTRDNMTESGLLVPEDAQIDLQPLIHDYAILEIPISPLCKPDCKGLCTECGENLNITNCGHTQGSNDSPFATLKDLLN